MLKVHFAPNSRAGRIIWLMEELELEYEVNVMPFSKEGLKSDEHRARTRAWQSSSLRRW
jgi:glutathione S-transferase